MMGSGDFTCLRAVLGRRRVALTSFGILSCVYMSSYNHCVACDHRMRTQAIRLDVLYSFECHASAFADPRYETPTCPSKPRPRNGKACLWRWQPAKPHRRRHDGRLHNRFIEQHLASYANLCTARTLKLRSSRGRLVGGMDDGVPLPERAHCTRSLVPKGEVFRRMETCGDGACSIHACFGSCDESAGYIRHKEPQHC